MTLIGSLKTPSADKVSHQVVVSSGGVERDPCDQVFEDASSWGTVRSMAATETSDTTALRRQLGVRHGIFRAEMVLSAADLATNIGQVLMEAGLSIS